MGQRRTRNSNFWANYTSFIPIVGSGISRSIRQNALSKNQAEEAAQINPVDVTYQESPYAKEQLALARNAQNARMPGGAQMEANAYRNQSNTMLNLSRAAGSPQAMMAAAGAVQGTTNNALGNLAIQEAQYKTQMMGNTNNALQGMTIEQGKVFNDQLRKYQRDYDTKQTLLNSSQQNAANAGESLSGAMNSLYSTALNLATGGMGGGMMGGTGARAANQASLASPGTGLTDSQLLQGGYAQPFNNFNAGSPSWFTPPRRP
jgi:hypothetical protein